MEFSHKVISYIKAHQLCSEGAKLIVGVSGGADSIALLHFLHNAGYECIVAHCNFHLRGIESDTDEAFVKDFAEKWHIPFFSTSFDTKTFAKEKGISIEMAARDLRYDWFDVLKQEQNADAIAIAHHLDDSIETFFINLSRGTGLRGLLGIQPKQGSIIRPFLSVSRDDINNYISINHLQSRIDLSNFDQLIIRNKIRHSLIPIFESFNPSFRQIMMDNFTRLGELSEVANTLIESFKKEAVIDHEGYISISISKLRNQTNTHYFLFELLKPYNFNDATVNDILYHIDGESGKSFFSSTHRAIKDRNYLLVTPYISVDSSTYSISEDTFSINKPINLVLSQPISIETTSIVKNNNVACIDFEKLTFPLKIRRPKEGDFFYPLGMKGKKKLSDFFIDKKFNLLEKENCWLLTSEDQIVWVIGYRIDDRFKIDDNSKKMIKISLSKDIV
ncbi:tRNA lysidine(34) synthetase TilS [Paludibacter sp.]|uniref:tRNA lysidine(34) synthetase TilS n=1 Tax=Paludibacter sp. TaxID=1898105 RepID=UPI0013524747|nr:tRNA lysidine(34) synthetase TilS [Paludibacter sp.]MTK54247.1 tRNA lysidine(34) synthetase TilS [Paludibacter sp.]